MSTRVAAIGVGHLGRHHARILGTLPDATLVAVADTNRPRADEIAAANNTRAVYDARELIGQVDAVSIAAPTEQHLAIALPFLEAGVQSVINLMSDIEKTFRELPVR